MTDVKQKTLNLLKKLNTMKGGRMTDNDNSQPDINESMIGLISCQEKNIEHLKKTIHELNKQIMMMQQQMQQVSLPPPMNPQPQIINQTHNNMLVGMQRFHGILQNYVKNNNNGCCIVGHMNKLNENLKNMERSPNVSEMEKNFEHLNKTMNCVNNSHKPVSTSYGFKNPPTNPIYNNSNGVADLI